MSLCKVIASLFILVSGLCQAGEQYAVFAHSAPATFSGEAVIQSESAYYVGNIKNGVPHGQGLMMDHSGQVISGEWVNGAFNGKGVTIDLAPVKTLKASKEKSTSSSHNGVLIIEQQIYQGPFNHLQLPHGKGTCYKGSKQSPCTYKNGIRQ